MNVKIETRAMQFPEKEYINGIFVAVQDKVFRRELNIQKEFHF
jgi:hypothetical protein